MEEKIANLAAPLALGAGAYLKYRSEIKRGKLDVLVRGNNPGINC